LGNPQSEGSNRTIYEFATALSSLGVRCLQEQSYSHFAHRLASSVRLLRFLGLVTTAAMLAATNVSNSISAFGTCGASRRATDSFSVFRLIIAASRRDSEWSCFDVTHGRSSCRRSDFIQSRIAPIREEFLATPRSFDELTRLFKRNGYDISQRRRHITSGWTLSAKGHCSLATAAHLF